MSDNTQKSKIEIMERQLQRALNLNSPINAITAHAPTKSSSSHIFSPRKNPPDIFQLASCFS